MSKAFHVDDSFARWFVNIIKDAEHLLFATVAFVMAKVGAFTDPKKPLPPRFFKYYGFAISSMRERLQTPGAWADDAIIVSVLFLALLDLANGNRKTFLIHKKQLGAMVGSRGGLIRFKPDSLVRVTLQQ
jgi:Fungal specific transcription factor domain